LRDRLRQKQFHATPSLNAQRAQKTSAPKRRESFLPVNTQAEFACGD
jgi:hypothetical protein